MDGTSCNSASPAQVIGIGGNDLQLRQPCAAAPHWHGRTGL
jgi:hypothetical protein